MAATNPNGTTAGDEPGRFSFAEDFVLVTLSRKCPDFRVLLEEVKSELAGQLLDPREVRSRADLLPEDLRDALNAAFKPFGALKESHTVPYALPGVRVVPRSRWDDFFARFRSLEQAFAADIERFFAEYEGRVRQRAREYWGPILGEEYERKIGRHLPPLARLREKVGVKAKKFRMSFEDARDADEAMRELAEGLRDRVAAAADELRDQLAAGKVLKAETFSKMLAAIDTLKGFGAFADQALLSAVDVLEGRIRKASDDADAARLLRDATMTQAIKRSSSALISGIDSLMDACRDRAGVEAAVGRFGNARRIRVARPDGG